MNRKVKRYDPISSDGTCGMCIEDADYGAYVEYEDYAALEAEVQRLRAENERLRAGATVKLPESLWSGDIGDSVIKLDDMICALTTAGVPYK